MTHLWRELHEFERAGLIIQYFLESGGFGSLATASFRNWPRPVADRYYGRTFVADPLHIVSGVRQ